MSRHAVLRTPYFVLLLLSALCPLPSAYSIEVYFSPHGGCTEAVCREIAHAQNEILVQAYSFTSEPIVSALVKAAHQQVLVKVILDAGQEHQAHEAGSPVHRLWAAGVEVLIDDQHAIAHNKVMVIDGKTVLTGSFNFTDQAERHNAENLLVIHDKSLADRYRENWQEHLGHSRRPRIAMMSGQPSAVSF